MHGAAGFGQQPANRFIDQRLPRFGTGRVTTNHVLVALTQHMRLLAVATSRNAGQGGD